MNEWIFSGTQGTLYLDKRQMGLSRTCGYLVLLVVNTEQLNAQ